MPSLRRLGRLRAQLAPAAASAAEPSAAPFAHAHVPEHWRLSQVPAGPLGPRTRLTEAEKRQFYKDG